MTRWRRLLEASLLAGLGVCPAWAGCPEDLAATGEYAGLLERGRQVSDQGAAKELARRQTLLDQQAARIRELQKELDTLKAPVPKEPEGKK